MHNCYGLLRDNILYVYYTASNYWDEVLIIGFILCDQLKICQLRNCNGPLRDSNMYVYYAASNYLNEVLIIRFMLSDQLKR